MHATGSSLSRKKERKKERERGNFRAKRKMIRKILNFILIQGTHIFTHTHTLTQKNSKYNIYILWCDIYKCEISFSYFACLFFSFLAHLFYRKLTWQLKSKWSTWQGTIFLNWNQISSSTHIWLTCSEFTYKKVMSSIQHSYIYLKKLYIYAILCLPLLLLHNLPWLVNARNEILVHHPI